jgi:hypothetical protein
VGAVLRSTAGGALIYVADGRGPHSHKTRSVLIPRPPKMVGRMIDAAFLRQFRITAISSMDFIRGYRRIHGFFDLI